MGEAMLEGQYWRGAASLGGGQARGGVGRDVVVGGRGWCPGRRQLAQNLWYDQEIPTCMGETNAEKIYTVEPPSWNDCDEFHFAQE